MCHQTCCTYDYMPLWQAICRPKTIRAFAVRVCEHIAMIKSGDIKHNVPRHYREHHNRDPKGSEFQIIDKYIPSWREAMTRGVSCLENILAIRVTVPLSIWVEHRVGH